MKNRKLTLGIYCTITLMLALAAAVLRTVAVLGYLDLSSGYFAENIYIKMGNIITIFTVLIGISYTILGRSELKLIPSFSGGATYIPSAAVAVSLLFIAIELFRRATSASNTEWLTLVTAVFTLPAILGFFFTVLHTERENEARGWLCMAIVVFLAIYSAYLYFDSKLPLNSPCKTVDRMAFLGAAAFFLFETRISLGREKWKGYSAFGLIGASLALYSALPSLIVYLVRREVISNSIYETVLMLAIFVFITARLILTINLPEDKESEFVRFIKENEKSELKLNQHCTEDRESENENYSIDFSDINEENK